MSETLKPVQVRLPSDVYAVLEMLSAAHDKDLGEVARELLCKCLMGEGHAIKVLQDRLSRATTSDKKR